MSLSNAAETALLTLLFKNTDWANIGDAGGLQNSATDGVFYISLHTADPGEAGAQNTTESAYTNYARQSVVRTAAGWTVSGNAVSNAAAITFPACGTTGSTVTYFGIGTDVSGAGNLIASGLLSSGGLVISSGITPSFAIGALTATAD
jgi:hypothetical protein